MRRSKVAAAILIWALVSLFAAQQTAAEVTVPAAGDYLGQPLPGDEPVLFAPGIVNIGLYTRDVAMTPDGDEIYFTVNVGARHYTAMIETRRGGGVWTEPEVAPFSSDPRWFNIEPAISSDGQRFFFVSNRPSGRTYREADSDIWVMDRKSGAWGEPYNLGAPINTDQAEYFPSVTRDGTIYFTRENLTTGECIIYRARPAGNGYAEPERLNERVNAGTARFNAFIAPDESYLILPIFGREDSLGGIDYYVCFRDQDDNWSEPINLGDRVNTKGSEEYSAYVSPDGRFLFFMSPRALPDPERLTWSGLRQMNCEPGHGTPAIWWMRADFISSLRPADTGAGR